MKRDYLYFPPTHKQSTDLLSDQKDLSDEQKKSPTCKQEFFETFVELTKKFLRNGNDVGVGFGSSINTLMSTWSSVPADERLDEVAEIGFLVCAAMSTATLLKERFPENKCIHILNELLVRSASFANAFSFIYAVGCEFVQFTYSSEPPNNFKTYAIAGVVIGGAFTGALLRCLASSKKNKEENIFSTVAAGAYLAFALSSTLSRSGRIARFSIYEPDEQPSDTFRVLFSVVPFALAILIGIGYCCSPRKNPAIALNATSLNNILYDIGTTLSAKQHNRLSFVGPLILAKPGYEVLARGVCGLFSGRKASNNRLLLEDAVQEKTKQKDVLLSS